MPYGPATIPHLPPVWTGLYPYPKRSRQRWEIRHGAGTLDVSVRNARGLRWLFPDGTTSTAARPSKVVGAGTTLVTCDDFAERGVEVQVHNNVATLTPEELPDLRWRLELSNTSSITGLYANLPRVEYHLAMQGSGIALTGSASDLPRVQNYLYVVLVPALSGAILDLPRVNGSLYLNGTGVSVAGSTADLPRVTGTLYCQSLPNITGDVALLPRVATSLYLISLAGIVGDVAGVPRVSSLLYLQALAGITGDVVNLPANTSERRCYSCVQVTGDLPVLSTNTPIYFYGNTAVSAAEYDQTIANCVAAGGTNRTLYISSRRTAASDADKATLIGRGWTVNDSTA